MIESSLSAGHLRGSRPVCHQERDALQGDFRYGACLSGGALPTQLWGSGSTQRGLARKAWDRRLCRETVQMLCDPSETTSAATKEEQNAGITAFGGIDVSVDDTPQSCKVPGQSTSEYSSMASSFFRAVALPAVHRAMQSILALIRFPSSAAGGIRA